jgi:hypothetical protein
MGEGGTIQQVDAVTALGIARASFSIARPGLLEIRANSDKATVSVVLQLNVSNEGFSVTVLAPTLVSGPTSTPKAVATPSPVEPSPLTRGSPGFGGWVFVMLVLGGMAYLAYWSGRRYASSRWGMRWATCTVLGGLLVYNYLALQLPGSTALVHSTGLIGILGVVLIGALFGWGMGFGWSYLFKEPRKQSDLSK